MPDLRAEDRSLLDELGRKIAGRKEGEGAVEIRRRRGPWTLRLRVADADRLGVLLDEAELAREGPAEPGDLERQAKGLHEELRSYGERMALLEIEEARGRAILRSATPLLLPEAIEYDEAELEGGRRVVVRRYRFDRPSGERRPVPANLGAEALPRLARELLEAVTR
jgi:hypothetical protein